MLDAKYIKDPGNSPYIPNSACFWKARENALKELDNLLERYRHVINDPITPARQLNIITNNEAAAGFFQNRLNELGIPGGVIIQKIENL